MHDGNDISTLTDDQTLQNTATVGTTDHLGTEDGDHLDLEAGKDQDKDKKSSSDGGNGPPPPDPSLGGDGNPGGNNKPPPPPADGGGDNNPGGPPILETQEAEVEPLVEGTGTSKSEQEPFRGGGGGGLGLPLLAGVPFTAGEVAMAPLDLSGYRSKQRASKAAGMYDAVSKAVQSRVGDLVGVANEIARLHAEIDAEAGRHVAGLQASQEALRGHIATSRAALSAESEAASGRVRAAIGAERGSIREAAAGARGTLNAGVVSMRATLQGGHQRALESLSGGYDRAGAAVSTGVQAYRGRIGERMRAAQERLAMPGKDDLWTCVHYQVRASLGKQFGDKGVLFKVLDELVGRHGALVLESYSGHQGKLSGLRSRGLAAADVAARSGEAEVASYERSALAALDETERAVLAQVQAATASAAASLDIVEQSRAAAIEKASGQAGADAAELKKSTEGALWSQAHVQGEALVATGEAAAAPLKERPSKKAAEAALTAVAAVPLDTTTAGSTAASVVGRWAEGHAAVRSALDGSAGGGAERWRADALRRVADAEQRSLLSVASTSKGSQDGLRASATRLAGQIQASGTQTAAALARQAGTLSTAMVTDANTFVSGLDAHAALDTSALGQLDATRQQQYQTVRKDYEDRAQRCFAAMFDAGVMEGTDETKLFTALRGIGAYGAGALSQVYREVTGRKSIYADIRGDLDDTEYAIAQAYLSNNDAKGVQLELAYHQSGFWGEDTDAIKDLLKSLSADQLAAVKAEPGWKEAEAALYQDLKGDDLDLRVVQSLVAGNKARAEALELIDKIVEARWDESEDALRQAIEGIPEDSRKEILVQFAVIQELAGRKGGLEAVDFTRAELDEELAAEMGQDATGQDGAPIEATNDDLTRRNVSVAEQRFGQWATQDKLADDALYQQGGPGAGDVALTTLGITMLSPGTSPINIAAAYELEKSEITNSHVLDDDFKDLVLNKGTFGSTSLQGRAAGVRYEAQTGGSTEKAYNELKYEHTDDQGAVTNSAFKSDEEREASHEEWKNTFQQVYEQQYGTSVQSDIASSEEFSGQEKTLLQETRRGGQGNATMMIDYAQDGMGTEEWAAESALTGASREDIDAWFAKNPAARQRLLSEFSGDELEKMRVLMVGKVETDRQRWEIAQIRWDFTRGSGAGSLNTALAAAMGPAGAALLGPGAPKISANHFWDLLSGSGQMMDFNYQQMQAMIAERGGEDRAFDENGMLVVLPGEDQDAAVEQTSAFRGHGEVLEKAEESYKASMDAYTDLIASIAGIVAGAALSILTAGAAAPAVVALLSGLTTMATKAALKGDRYGWEEMLKDSAVLALEVATAGLAEKLTRVVKVSHASKADDLILVTAAEIEAYKLPKSIELGLKAGESFVSSTGKTLMDEKTYDQGFGEGVLKAFSEGAKGVGSTYIGHVSKQMSGEIFGGIEEHFQIQSTWARGALGVGKAALSSYASGELNLLVSDMVSGENTFADKQFGLAETAMFVAASKVLTVRGELDADDKEAASKKAPGDEALKTEAQKSKDHSDQASRYVDAGKDISKTLYDAAR